jgi:hypothetical protein
LTQAFALEPAYEQRIMGGWSGIGIFLGAIAVGEVVIYWGLSSGRNPQEYYGVALGFLFVLPVCAYLLILSAREGRGKLAPFVNSNAGMIRSWACVGPLAETGGFEADCEFSNGCYVQCVFGVLSRGDRKGGLLRVFRFVQGPETVSEAPLFKAKNDKETLQSTRFSVRDDVLDSWKNSETSWKRLVSTDGDIRSWIGTHFGWNKFKIKQPFPGDVLNGFVLSHDVYLRSPTCKGEWLKGKTFGVFLNFIEPTDQQEIKDFYSSAITIADKIIQHVKDTTLLQRTA